ncbi:f-box-like domain-containing protein [Sarocladium implicatum]|nr:f-box-like domain-containing protein [Sarocladium implicatum]
MHSDNQSATLTSLPTEILLDVFQSLDLQSVSELSLTCRQLHDIFMRRKSTILLPIISRDYSPLDELLQVCTASADDIATGQGVYVPRRVIYKRDAGDAGVVLAAGGGSKGANSFTQVPKHGRLGQVGGAQTSTTVRSEKDLDPILKHCQLVRAWQGLFPQMRWFHEPENCRMLRTHESHRFRRALYRWWLYSIHFHGDSPRPRVGLPADYVEDVRTSQLRYHSTSELLELMDMMVAVKDLVFHYICPRLDPTHVQSLEQSPLMTEMDRSEVITRTWMDQSEWGRIVKTYAKLGPEQLMHYFDNICSYPRKRLIADVHVHLPNFTSDQESILGAIWVVLNERMPMDQVPSLAEHSNGGIIDFGDERDLERLAFGADGSPDGGLPPGVRYRRETSQWSPRGDDGRYLEDHCQHQYGSGRMVALSHWEMVRQ